MPSMPSCAPGSLSWGAGVHHALRTGREVGRISSTGGVRPKESTFPVQKTAPCRRGRHLLKTKTSGPFAPRGGGSGPCSQTPGFQPTCRGLSSFRILGCTGSSPGTQAAGSHLRPRLHPYLFACREAARESWEMLLTYYLLMCRCQRGHQRDGIASPLR